MAEQKNAERLEQLAQETQDLLEQAMKNASLDSETLSPWGEMLGAMLMTEHNLHYYHGLMARLRASIETGTFRTLIETLRNDWNSP